LEEEGEAFLGEAEGAFLGEASEEESIILISD